jgi:hypothetical protein
MQVAFSPDTTAPNPQSAAGTQVACVDLVPELIFVAVESLLGAKF